MPLFEVRGNEIQFIHLNRIVLYLRDNVSRIEHCHRKINCCCYMNTKAKLRYLK